MNFTPMQWAIVVVLIGCASNHLLWKCRLAQEYYNCLSAELWDSWDRMNSSRDRMKREGVTERLQTEYDIADAQARKVKSVRRRVEFLRYLAIYVSLCYISGSPMLVSEINGVILLGLTLVETTLLMYMTTYYKPALEYTCFSSDYPSWLSVFDQYLFFYQAVIDISVLFVFSLIIP